MHTYRTRLVHVTQGDIHVVIAGDQVAIERLAVFQLYELHV